MCNWSNLSFSISVSDIKPSFAYNSYSNQGSAVLAALNNPQPPALLPVGAIASQLNAPVNHFRHNPEMLYAKTMSSALERDQLTSLSKNNPNLASLMNFKADAKSLAMPVKSEPMLLETDQSHYIVQKMENAYAYKTDPNMVFKQETDHSAFMKSSHDLFEPSPPKAVPVAVETETPEMHQSAPEPEVTMEMTALKPAAAVSQT